MMQHSNPNMTAAGAACLEETLRRNYLVCVPIYLEYEELEYELKLRNAYTRNLNVRLATKLLDEHLKKELQLHINYNESPLEFNSDVTKCRAKIENIKDQLTNELLNDDVLRVIGTRLQHLEHRVGRLCPSSEAQQEVVTRVYGEIAEIVRMFLDAAKEFLRTPQSKTRGQNTGAIPRIAETTNMLQANQLENMLRNMVHVSQTGNETEPIGGGSTEHTPQVSAPVPPTQAVEARETVIIEDVSDEDGRAHDTSRTSSTSHAAHDVSRVSDMSNFANTDATAQRTIARETVGRSRAGMTITDPRDSIGSWASVMPRDLHNLFSSTFAHTSQAEQNNMLIQLLSSMLETVRERTYDSGRSGESSTRVRFTDEQPVRPNRAEPVDNHSLGRERPSNIYARPAPTSASRLLFNERQNVIDEQTFTIRDGGNGLNHPYSFPSMALASQPMTHGSSRTLISLSTGRPLFVESENGFCRIITLSTR